MQRDKELEYYREWEKQEDTVSYFTTINLSAIVMP